MTHSQSDLNTALAILQQSEYDCTTLKSWWKRNLKKNDKFINPEKWTPKLYLIFYLSKILLFLPLITKICVANKLTKLPEFVISTYKVKKATAKLREAQKNGLIVVAVAGSYAKTSTKHWLAHLLKTQYNVLHPDKSINTPLGISQTILSQLKNTHQLFVVELGEYYQGDILKLARMINPDYGIITPIGHQHLERMSSITKIAETIGELIVFFKNKNQVQNTTEAVALPVICALENKPYFDKLFANLTLEYYGLESKSPVTKTQSHKFWLILKNSVSRSGTEVVISTPESANTYKLFTPLYGVHQTVNSLPAFWLASKLYKSSSSDNSLQTLLQEMAQAGAKMPFIPQRHQPQFVANNVLILDNSYNTNPESFDVSLALLKDLKPTKSFVITLGFVELGSLSTKMHQKLGKKLAKTVDYVGIIDSSQASVMKQAFEEAGGKSNQVVIADSPKSCLTQLQKFIIPGSVILFEGGYKEVLV
jgi:UDP-N-acetylmuramoyl-tripeptide--D-alanyl-D-alanine ligase